jgi:acid phosphatase
MGYCAAGAPALPRPAHVVLVIEENRAFGEIIGSADAPYINELAKQGALFTRSYAIGHPSEPNYVALFSGDTQGVQDDSCPHRYDKPNLASALLQQQLSFAIYSENMPTEGFEGCASPDKLYRRKHNPVPDFSDIPAGLNKPFSAFPVDYSKLPTVAFVVPNMLDDMHDGTVQQADAWLKSQLADYIRWAKDNNSLLIITWDEDDGTDDNRIATLVIGAGIKPGRYAEKITHYDLLRTITDIYGVKPVGHATEAKAIDDIWK